MRLSVPFFVALAVIGVVSGGHVFTQEGVVFCGKDCNLAKEVMNQDSHYAVMFVQPHPEAERLMKAFSVAAAAFAGQGVVFASVLCHENKNSCREYHIVSEVSLKVFLKGTDKMKVINKVSAMDAAEMGEAISEKTGVEVQVDAAVRTLTEKNFKEVTEDPLQDVFVKFYAPYCGHCKAAAPIIEAIGEDNRETNPYLTLAKVNVAAKHNHKLAEELNIQKMPTFFFYPRLASDKNYDPETDEFLFQGPKKDKFEAFLNKFTTPNQTWMNKECGENKRLSPDLNTRMENFLRAEVAMRKTFVKSANKAAKKLPEDSIASYYVKVMKKISADGLAFARTEFERLSDLVNTDVSLTTEQRDDLIAKCRVLNFTLDTIDAISKEGGAIKDEL